MAMSLLRYQCLGQMKIFCRSNAVVQILVILVIDHYRLICHQKKPLLVSIRDDGVQFFLVSSCAAKYSRGDPESYVAAPEKLLLRKNRTTSTTMKTTNIYFNDEYQQYYGTLAPGTKDHPDTTNHHQRRQQQ